MGVRLTESKHATSEGSSDASHHGDHHCADGVHVHCDDGVGLRGGAEFLYESDEGSSGLWYVLLCPYDEHVPAPIHVVEYGPLWHDHESLNDLCSGDGETDYVLQHLGAYVARCEHSMMERSLQDFQ
jgi:hypothetical protein